MIHISIYVPNHDSSNGTTETGSGLRLSSGDTRRLQNRQTLLM